jgi:predicted nucleic acid-binding protein
VRYVLDTNIVARLLEGDQRVVPRVNALAADSFGMPLVVFAELLFGVEKSARREANRARLEAFAAGVRVLPFDVALATRPCVPPLNARGGPRPTSISSSRAPRSRMVPCS